VQREEAGWIRRTSVALAQCGRIDAAQSHEQSRAWDFGGVIPRRDRPLVERGLTIMLAVKRRAGWVVGSAASKVARKVGVGVISQSCTAKEPLTMQDERDEHASNVSHVPGCNTSSTSCGSVGTWRTHVRGT
jgi:hypothetical protein